MANRIAGIAFISVDGRTFPLAGDCSYSPVTVKRTSLIGQDGVHGFSEEPVAPYIKMSVRDDGGFSVADFNGMTDVTVVAELANGKVVTGRNMWQVDDLEVETLEAKFAVRFEAKEGSVTEN